MPAVKRFLPSTAESELVLHSGERMRIS